MAHDGKEAREEILARLDIRTFYEHNGVEKWVGSSSGRDWIEAKCPMHDDRSASFGVNVKTGQFKCHAVDCPASGGGSPFDWIMLKDGCDFRTALSTLALFTGVKLPDARPEIDATLPNKFHEQLMRNKSLREWCNASRGWSNETLSRFLIGWDGDRITIPVYDEDGKLVNIRRYLPAHMRKSSSERKQPKFLNYTQGGVRYGEGRVFNVRALVKAPEGAEVLICAGEPDCLLLNQLGFLAVTSTTGEGAFLPTWAQFFRGKNVTIIYDFDAAGVRGSERVAKVLTDHEIPAKIARLPESVGRGGDVTDYIVTLGGTAHTLKEHVLDKAELWEEKIEEEHDPVEVTLPESSRSEYFGMRIRSKIVLSGKDTTPYVVPKKVKATCSTDGRKACSWCSMFTAGGNMDVEFSEKDRELIGFTVASDLQVTGAIVRKMRANARCEALKLETVEQLNLEELRLIPELDYFNENAQDEEYVQRMAYYMGQGLRSNQSYEIEGVAQSDPRSQYSMLVINKATPAQDSISSFEMTPELAERLRIFQCPATLESVQAKFDEIATDFESNVHRIYDRKEMQTALDLTWHSVIGFDLSGKMIRKGWVECLIMGDSGQGKSEMTKCLLHHYGLGDRVQGEQVSIAGLVGGVEQTSKRWMLTWGKMPLNDRRLLVVEEVSGMDEEQLGKLSDVRSTGVAEITKMRTERTNARCRLVFISNPREGRAISTYNHGVMTILKLFGKAEDVRRLDFAIVVASGEVSDAAFDRVLRQENREHRFTSQLCKRLILWAWSRMPSQVIFTDEALQEITLASREFSSTYSTKIPLVEPADQRVKFARLAASVACRVFSTNGDNYNEVLVDAAHVRFVREYLRSQYNKPAMSYDDFSRISDSGERLDPDEYKEVIEQFKKIGDWADLVLEMRKTGTYFRKNELELAMGWEKEQVRTNFRLMTRLGCIRSTSRGFYKTPFFNQMLRDLDRNGSGRHETNGHEDELPFNVNVDEELGGAIAPEGEPF